MNYPLVQGPGKDKRKDRGGSALFRVEMAQFFCKNSFLALGYSKLLLLLNWTMTRWKISRSRKEDSFQKKRRIIQYCKPSKLLNNCRFLKDVFTQLVKYCPAKADFFFSETVFLVFDLIHTHMYVADLRNPLLS